MSMLLTAPNKIGFLDGMITRPDNADPQSNAWKQWNYMILCWILNSMYEGNSIYFIFIDQSEEMWKDLKDRFSQSHGPRIYQLKKLISPVTQENSSVNSYHTQLKGCWDHLSNYLSQISCSCGSFKELVEYQQQQKSSDEE